jgi:hypothetical protein
MRTTSSVNRRYVNNRSYSKKDTVVFCEDEKSSYYYLEELIKEYRRGSQIELETVKGQNPKQIIDKAIEYRDDKNNKNIQHIFCVFDMDKIRRREISGFYEPQLNNYISKADNNNIKCIICDPKFEFYILLNFEETGTIDEMEIKNKLNIHFPNQNIDEIKKDKKLFAKLVRNKDCFFKAIERNERAFNNEYNRTNFFELIGFIIGKSKLS